MKPFDFKEGDCVCVCEEHDYHTAQATLNSLSMATETATEATTAAATPLVPADSAAAVDSKAANDVNPSLKPSRAEDILYQIFASSKKRLKKSGGHGSDGTTSTTKTQARRFETALTIGGDLNFSDEDDDNE